MESNKIRQAFLDFFESKGPCDRAFGPMVVKGDPTLMFTNAGMNQFKDIFLGNAPRKYPRAADTQKCLRVSGKHNDLEEVGHDTYHHTMFEMLGNWSYGDYFKKEAIEWAWELLHGVYELPAERMYATVFEGSEEDGVPFDQEAYDYWTQLPARGPYHPRQQARQFLGDGRDGTLRTLLGNPLRPARRGGDRRQAGPRDGQREPSAGDRDLEPRLHAVQPQGKRLAGGTSGAQRRHGHGLRAPLHDPPGQEVELRHRRFPAYDRPHSRRCRARNTARTGSATWRCA